MMGRELIVTHGSQEAIFITAQALLKHGDDIALESLCYPAARAALTEIGPGMPEVGWRLRLRQVRTTQEPRRIFNLRNANRA
jgi:aspartate/methionine/tyrosine aminotransferase